MFSQNHSPSGGVYVKVGDYYYNIHTVKEGVRGVYTKEELEKLIADLEGTMREMFTETFEQIHRSQDATMIIISHQERIIQLADEIVVVAGGTIANRGTTEEIFPLILANTLGGCPVLRKEEQK